MILETLNISLVDWSRAQFALTAMYHWLFVPLTLGLAVIMGIMETIYVIKKDDFWRRTTKFWMKLFGINFAVGVATGLILEFEFGTNWSNYSWFVGDIFGAPLAIEGIVAFFLEATFLAVMFFGWDKVSRRFHLTATWLTGIGATLSAWWILVANAWMQHPVGMAFNPNTVRNEMTDFASVALSPVAVTKFFHAVLSGWMTGAAFVIGISCWYLWKKREQRFAYASIKIAAVVGFVATMFVAWTGDGSAREVAQNQPMKLAAFEALEDGGHGVGFTVVGGIKIPKLLSILATRDLNGYVPGINDLLKGGYTMPDGTKALSAEEKMARGATALQAFKQFREAKHTGDTLTMLKSRETLDKNVNYFGYGYIQNKADLVPNVPLLFWMFRVMVGLGCYLILFFAVLWYLSHKRRLEHMSWLLIVAIITVPLTYLAGQAGWVVAEVGRQPWAIHELLPLNAAVSDLKVGSVQFTFFLFLILFTILLIAELGIMFKAIQKGPEEEKLLTSNY